jgi:hypothetical protein
MEPHSNKGGVPTYLERTQMIKKVITYVDYNGKERTEAFYFNLTKAELTEMELTTNGGLADHIQRIVDAQDSKQLIELFKSMLLLSYGEKSPDGKRFIKNQELRDAFSQTEAYSQLYMDLVTNTELAIEFVNGIIPEIKKE